MESISLRLQQVTLTAGDAYSVHASPAKNSTTLKGEVAPLPLSDTDTHSLVGTLTFITVIRSPD